jgi:hypothetical protein
MERPVFVASKLDIARIQEEFQKKFVFGKNSNDRPSRADIEDLVAPYKDTIERIPGVNGLAFGIRTLRTIKKPIMDYVFKIYINPKSNEERAELTKKIPKSIGSYEVVFVEGMPQAAWGGCSGSDFTHHDPLEPGINVGLPHGGSGPVGTCGTLGMIVWKKGQSHTSADTERYFLSAWHVLTQNGSVPGPSEISHPGNSYNKPDIVGITDDICGPVCSKFQYEVGLVRIDSYRQVVNGYVAQKDPYDPGLPPLPDLLVYKGCGISKHVVGGTPSIGGCVAGYYRDFFLFVDIMLGTAAVRMENQMIIEALYPGDIITNPGDSGMVWTDSDGYPIAITVAQGTYLEPFNFNQSYNCAIASWLERVFDELRITGIKPAPTGNVTYPVCIVARALDNPREQAILEREISPALHNSGIEPWYHELRVGGKYHRELYKLTFSDPELAALANETSRALLNAYNELMKGVHSGPAIDERAVDVFGEYVKKVSPMLSSKARDYLLKLLGHVEALPNLSREELVQKYKINKKANLRIAERFRSERVDLMESGN